MTRTQYCWIKEVQSAKKNNYSTLFRLFVGGIPKNKQKSEILTEMKKLSEGVIDVIVYPSAGDKAKNRGFAFVEYQDHHTAAMARR